MTNKLTIKQENFCKAYFDPSNPDCGNSSAAYRASYGCGKMKPESIHRRAHDVLKNSKVQARLKELREKAGEKIDFKVQDVLRNWVLIATADPNDIIQHRRNCCRYCWGVGHARQWVDTEYALLCAKALDSKRTPPEAPGGFGFDAHREPNPICPMCFGDGLEIVYLADTRKLKGAARRLYGGLKKKRDGVEVIFRNQDAALENIAKFLGMFKQDDGNIPLGNAPIVPIRQITTDPTEASRIYLQLMQ
jgi:phage terminase small subunit